MIKLNIKIEKVGINNEEVLDFLAFENLKMFMELRPEMKKTFDGGFENQLVKMFINNYKNKIQNDTTIYGAFYNDEIVGVAEFSSNNYLMGFYVKEEYRNQLIGTKLLERLIGEYNNSDVIRVDVRTEAISLFERFSFKRDESAINRIFVPMELRKGCYGK